MKLFRRLLALTLLSAAGWFTWKHQDQLTAFYQQRTATPNLSAEAVPDPERYQDLITTLSSRREDLAQRYSRARTASEIMSVRSAARLTLEEELPKLMRCWLGTPWDFNGTCKTPGSGKIACGYYVSTVLRDAGFSVERIRLAQQPSQNIIGTFLPRNEMHVRTRTSYDDFLKQVIDRGPGIRIVGLDTHVAFLVVTPEDDIHFIHSSGGAAKSVVDQDRDHAYVLRASKYRVTGNITGSDGVQHNWLTNTHLPTRL